MSTISETDSNHSSALLYVSYKDIPSWLRDSSFFQNLCSDEDDNFIEIPSIYFRATDCDVESTEDLINVLRVVNFWGKERIPQSVLEFCFAHRFDSWDGLVAETVGIHDPMYHLLKCAFQFPEHFSLSVAIDSNRPEIIDFWFAKMGPDSDQGYTAIAQACAAGRIDLVKKLRRDGYPSVFL